MQPMKLSRAFTLLESGPVVLVTTSDGKLLGIVDRQIVAHTVDETEPQM